MCHTVALAPPSQCATCCHRHNARTTCAFAIHSSSPAPTLCHHPQPPPKVCACALARRRAASGERLEIKAHLISGREQQHPNCASQCPSIPLASVQCVGFDCAIARVSVSHLNSATPSHTEYTPKPPPLSKTTQTNNRANNHRPSPTRGRSVVQSSEGCVP